MGRLTRARVLGACAVLAVLLLGAVALSLLFGTESLDLRRALSGDPTDPHAAILEARLPRVLLGVLCGAALSAGGAAFQGLLRNPLADPYILGVSGGAAIGATAALIAGLDRSVAGFSLVTIAAFAGSFGSVLLLGALARVGGRMNTYTLLLTGAIFNAIAAAIIALLKTVVSAEKAQELLYWLLGKLDYYESYESLAVLAATVAIGFAALFLLSGRLNAFALGDEEALSLGVDVERTKTAVLGASSLLVGAVVSVTGLIGFVGLIVPHAARLIVGPDHRILLPVACLGGAVFLLVADLLSRLLFGVFETDTPVGVVTAVVGGPIFLVLLRRRTLQGMI